MTSRFNDNQIIIQKKSVPALPTTSNELVLFFDGTELRTVDYSGKVSNFKQQVVEQIRVETDEATKSKVEQLVNDLNAISVNIFKELQETKQINSNEVIVLKNLISLQLEKVNNNLEILENTTGELEVAYETISKELIKAQISNSELEDKLLGVERDLQNKIDEASYEELKSLVRVELSAFDERLGRVTGELLSKFTLLSSLLSSFVTREDLEQVKLLIKPQKRVVSGSRNVRVQETADSFIISVDIPQQEQGGSRGGLTRSKVESLIQEALEGFVGGKEITSNDGSVNIVETDTTIDLSVDTSGISGGSNIVTLQAGQDLSAYRAIFIDDDGLCYYASPSTDAQKQIFLALESKSIGEFIKVALNGDVIFNSAWSFIPGSRLFVTGTSGQLSQTAPLTGNIFSLGVIIEPTKLQIQNQNSIVQVV